jgi:3-phenylpropionate/trans-cinnamate dioxygenase ferredoxin subunit
MSDEWIAIARDDALGTDEMQTVELGGRRLLLVRTATRHYLVDEMCSHEDYSLALGCIKGERIKCSLHGSYFDLTTGDPLDEPADEPIATYPLRVADGQVWARIPEP